MWHSLRGRAPATEQLRQWRCSPAGGWLGVWCGVRVVGEPPGPAGAAPATHYIVSETGDNGSALGGADGGTFDIDANDVQNVLALCASTGKTSGGGAFDFDANDVLNVSAPSTSTGESMQISKSIQATKNDLF